MKIAFFSLAALSMAARPVWMAARQTVLSHQTAEDKSGEAQATCPDLFEKEPLDLECGGPPPTYEDVQQMRCRFPDGRICEIVETVQGQKHVWNSFGCGDCPTADYDAITPAQLNNANKVGVWYLTYDTFRSEVPNEALLFNGEREVKAYGNVNFMKVAIMQKPAGGLYDFMLMGRKTTLRWRPGRQVYQLVLPDGAVFTQFWSEDQYFIKHEQIGLPPGWRLQCMIVGDDGLEIDTALSGGIANVTTDNLGNKYELTPPHCGQLLNGGPEGGPPFCRPEDATTYDNFCKAIVA